MDVTFNEIIEKFIDMIVNQLDSTHLSEPLHNTPTDQLHTRDPMLLSTTNVLDKTHSFTPTHPDPTNTVSAHPLHPLSFDTRVAIQQVQVAIKKDPYIKKIKAIKYK